MSSNTNDACIYIAIFILIFALFVFIIMNCIFKENFTAPGLTLTMPPNWFPQIAAKTYNPNDWKVKMYLDRYPFYDTKAQEYLTSKESDELASTNRFWIQ